VPEHRVANPTTSVVYRPERNLKYSKLFGSVKFTKTLNRSDTVFSIVVAFRKITKVGFGVIKMFPFQICASQTKTSL